MNRTKEEERSVVGLQAATVMLAIAVAIGIAALATVPTPVRADVVDVTTTWNIPVDISFTVTYPAPRVNITFAPSSATFTLEPAQTQTDALSSYNITNDGNANFNIQAIFQADLPTGVTLFETCTASSGNAPSGQCWTWTDTNDTTSNQTIVSALTPASTENLWAWSSGTNVVGGYTEVTYRLTSVAS